MQMGILHNALVVGIDTNLTRREKIDGEGIKSLFVFSIGNQRTKIHTKDGQLFESILLPGWMRMEIL